MAKKLQQAAVDFDSEPARNQGARGARDHPQESTPGAPGSSALAARSADLAQFSETPVLRPASDGCMASASSALPVAGRVAATTAKAKVETQPNSEAALVKRCQAGDEMAFREIVERHQAKVFSIIYGIVRHRNDAEDIAQQVFTKVYFSIRGFDLRSSLLTWIYKITVNECYDYLRKQKVRRLVYESDMSEDESRRLENTESPRSRQQPIDQRLEKRDYILKLLMKVPEEERMLLIEKEVEGRTVEELSASTGLNENTIKVKLFRARQKLVKASGRLGKAWTV
jgi:RNA polymerase sigma-70 factor, ECF subfamily